MSTPWTDQEEAYLLERRAAGIRYEEIALGLPGRTESAVRDRVRVLIRKGLTERLSSVRDSGKWPPERVEQLTALWCEKNESGAYKYSAAVIARLMRLKSKDAVVGKAHRLGLPKRPGIQARNALASAVARKRGPEPTRRIVIPMPKAQESEHMQEEEIPVIVPRRAVGFKTCQWISGRPTRSDECKCGAPVVPSPLAASYCAKHAAMSVQKPAKVERDAA